jgi:hypothetical protein
VAALTHLRELPGIAEQYDAPRRRRDRDPVSTVLALSSLVMNGTASSDSYGELALLALDLWTPAIVPGAKFASKA